MFADGQSADFPFGDLADEQHGVEVDDPGAGRGQLGVVAHLDRRLFDDTLEWGADGRPSEVERCRFELGLGGCQARLGLGDGGLRLEAPILEAQATLVLDAGLVHGFLGLLHTGLTIRRVQPAEEVADLYQGASFHGAFHHPTDGFGAHFHRALVLRVAANLDPFGQRFGADDARPDGRGLTVLRFAPVLRVGFLDRWMIRDGVGTTEIARGEPEDRGDGDQQGNEVRPSHGDPPSAGYGK